MRKPRYTLIGEGEDGISSSDWTEPVSRCQTLILLHENCESADIELPTDELSQHLILKGITNDPLTDNSRDSLSNLLEEVFGDDVRVDWNRYDRDMPGASSSYCKFYARTAKLKDINSSLKIIEDFLLSWSEESGLNSILAAIEGKGKCEASEPTDVKQSSEKEISLNPAMEAQRWEDDLFDEVSRTAKDESSEAYARLHFLVYKARIFYLDKDGWWHTLRGNPRKVADRLELSGHEIKRVSIRSSSRGWIPYFARKNSEERGLGWFDPGIELGNLLDEDKDQIAEARRGLLPRGSCSASEAPEE